MRVSPGVSPADMQAALAEFQKIVGAEWVFTDEEDVDLYRDSYSIFWDQPEERIVAAAVCPDSVDQVQAAVKVANRYGIPIYPVSTGKNLGYGGSAPAYAGSVVLDLKRMNRILRVDEDRGFVLVEPGVSYFDLYQHLRETGSRLMVDVPDPGWGSLVGNSLDHGAGYLQPTYRNHFESHCGMEVVLADGTLLRTGMGAMPGADSWQDFKFGVGPWIDGIFSQSNFGVVTKMGFWLMPEPEAHLEANAFAYRFEDLSPMVNALNYLENTGVANGMSFVTSPLYGGSSFVPRDQRVVDHLAGAGHDLSQEELNAFADANKVPYWSMTLKFYGPEDAVRANWNFCKKEFAKRVPGTTFDEGKLWRFPLTPEQHDEVHKPSFGIPSLEMFSRGARSPNNPDGDWGHIWFAPIIPRTGEAIIEANKVISEITARFDRIDSLRRVKFSTPTTYWARSFILLFGFSIKRDPEYDRKTLECLRTLIAECAKHGWGEYRASPVVHDNVAAAYSFNNNALTRFHERLKDAVDPNGIISAGRYGIWPKHLREKKG